MLLSAAMLSTIDDSYMNSGCPRTATSSPVSRALRFLVRRPRRLRETMESGKENVEASNPSPTSEMTNIENSQFSLNLLLSSI